MENVKSTLRSVLGSTMISLLLAIEGLWSLFGILRDNQKSFDIDAIFNLMYVVGVFGFSYYIISSLSKMKKQLNEGLEKVNTTLEKRLGEQNRLINEVLPEYLQYAFKVHVDLLKLTRDRNNERIDNINEFISKLPFVKSTPVPKSASEKHLSDMTTGVIEEKLQSYLDELKGKHGLKDD